MKSKYWAILLCVVMAVSLGLSFLLMNNTKTAARAEISSGGKLVRVVELAVDQEFTVTAEDGGTNTVTVKDGAIAVTAADCPDHYCMDRGFCTGGTQIVCLPNRLVISFLGEQEIDGVVG
ncbi:MAG: NusG domain II-containing protein [Oscillospiraceae bacterium]|nr:NusG domain II-containing protein [Oscillospiraceae bacterium]